MSGHSKWHSIKHKKAATDAKRGRIFTRILKEILIAARMGGGDIEGNPRLRSAVQTAKDANMPKDNIEKAIKKGSGEMEGISYEDFVFEGYGRAGVAVIVEGATDNRNRTTAEVRHIFGKFGGSLGETGCVAWMFHKKGIILIDPGDKTEDDVMECALEAGAEDMESHEGVIQVTTSMEDLIGVREAIEAAGIKVDSGKLELIPENTIEVSGKEAEQNLKLIGALEDQDDVTCVAANADFDPELVEQFS